MSNLVQLRELSLEKLQAELISMRTQQFNLRMKRAAGSLEKTHLFQQVKRTIAQIKTIMTEKAGDSHE